MGTMPSIGTITVTGKKTINIPVVQGTHPLQSIEVKVDGVVVASAGVTGTGTFPANYDFSNDATVTVTLTDSGLYGVTATYLYKKNP